MTQVIQNIQCTWCASVQYIRGPDTYERNAFHVTSHVIRTDKHGSVSRVSNAYVSCILIAMTRYLRERCCGHEAMHKWVSHLSFPGPLSRLFVLRLPSPWSLSRYHRPTYQSLFTGRHVLSILSNQTPTWKNGILGKLGDLVLGLNPFCLLFLVFHPTLSVTVRCQTVSD